MAIAPHTSLPCVSAWITACGPGCALAMVQTYGTPALPAAYAERSGNSTSIAGAAEAAPGDVRSGNGSGGAYAAHTWSASRAMNDSQRASCAIETHSLG